MNLLLNNGHGGEIKGNPITAGKRSPDNKGEYRFIEGTFNRAIVNKLNNKLDKLIRRPFNTIKVCDTLTDTSNYERVLFANKNGNPIDTFYLSIHADAAPSWYLKEKGKWRKANMRDRVDSHFVITNMGNRLLVKSKNEWISSARGLSVWTSRGTTKSDKCATIICEEMFTYGILEMLGGGRTDTWSGGDVDKEANFYELVQTTMPAVLVETGFMTNKDNVKMMLTNNFQDIYTDALVSSLKRIRKEVYRK